MDNEKFPIQTMVFIHSFIIEKTAVNSQGSLWEWVGDELSQDIGPSCSSANTNKSSNDSYQSC